MSAVRPLSFEPALWEHNESIVNGRKGWPVTKPVRRAIYSRDNNRCYYCGSDQNLTIDHKVPQAVGGSNHTRNLVTACGSCNSAKGKKSVSDFLRRECSGAAA